MARDSKIRMSIASAIIDKLDELRPKVIEATRHKPNSYQLQHITLPCLDGSEDVITFAFSYYGWKVYRHKRSKVFNRWMDENCWTIDKEEANVRITTYGKLTTDINREILDVIDQVEVQLLLIEDPIYCPVCEHCGETGCCGYINFLEKHVRGKTNCLYEETILDDLEEWIKEEDD